MNTKENPQQKYAHGLRDKGLYRLKLVVPEKDAERFKAMAAECRKEYKKCA